MMIRDRIKELIRVPAHTLLPNPKNWRTHPLKQADVLKGLLAELGFCDATLARETPAGLMLIDGHLRCETAADAMIPVLVLDVNEEEADKLLASLDSVTALAEPDAGKLTDLLSNLETQSAAVQQWFEELAEQQGVFDVAEAELPDLASGDRDSLHTMSFTLTADQEQTVKQALDAAKGMGDFIDTGNENSNGNALARIAEVFLGEC